MKKFKNVKKVIKKEDAKRIVDTLKEIAPDVILTDDEDVKAVNAALNLIIDLITGATMDG